MVQVPSGVSQIFINDTRHIPQLAVNSHWSLHAARMCHFTQQPHSCIPLYFSCNPEGQTQMTNALRVLCRTLFVCRKPVLTGTWFNSWIELVSLRPAHTNTCTYSASSPLVISVISKSNCSPGLNITLWSATRNLELKTTISPEQPANNRGWKERRKRENKWR